MPLGLACIREAEAEELTFCRPRYRTLLLVDLELEPSCDEARDIPLHPLSRPLAADVDVAVVRIPHEAVFAPFQLSIQFVEHQVRQEWREWPTLRRALLHRTHQPVLHHARREERPHQLEHPLVGDPSRYRCHQLVVVDPIEKLLQIEIHHPAASFGHVLLGLGDRLMRRTPGPEPVTVFRELRVPSALQNLHHRLLHHAVQHRRDAQLTHPSVRFRYLYPLHRLRLVSPVEQLFPDGWPVLPQVSGQLLDLHAVDTRTSLVGLHSLQSLQAVLPLANFFHHLLLYSRAFSPALRRGAIRTLC